MPDAGTKKILKLILGSSSALIILYLIYFFNELIFVLLVSVLLAFIFEPFVTLLEREGVKRFASTISIFILIGLGLYFSLSFFLPKLASQINALAALIKNYSTHEQIAAFEKQVSKYFPFIVSGELAQRIENILGSLVVDSFDQVTNLLSSLVSILAAVVIVPFITFFLLKDSPRIFRGILSIIPNKYFEMSYWIGKKISVQLGRFVRGWVFDAAFVGIACGIGFYAIGIANALPLGIIAGLGHLVPYFGPVIGGVPAILISIIQFGDLSKIPFLILLILGVYTVDNGLVQPYVFAKSVDMHPIIIILLIIAGSQVGGVFGMLLAVPTATVVRTAVKEIYFAFKNYKVARV